MNFGLVGWAVASGNGGMNSDIVQIASWVTHWLIPEHPTSPIHKQYVDKVGNKKIVECALSGDSEKYKKFLSEVDGIMYVEHPCLKEEFDIVAEAKKQNKYVVGIPMWEWWPERKNWAMQTDMLWAVTRFTEQYLTSLSNILFAHGWRHSWRHRVHGCGWGVNLKEFQYRQRQRAENFVFVNGNGGYKLRKASDLVYKAFMLPGAPPLTVYTQQAENLGMRKADNIRIVVNNFPDRSMVYDEGDVFLFPSYWEGLCHGLYEAQASGGLVITSDHPPMNECGTDLLIPISEYLQEDLSGKKIVKASWSPSMLQELCSRLHQTDISESSLISRENIVRNHNLEFTLSKLHDAIFVARG